MIGCRKLVSGGARPYNRVLCRSRTTPPVSTAGCVRQTIVVSPLSSIPSRAEYSTTVWNPKIHSFGSDGDEKSLSQEEMQKLIDAEEQRMIDEENEKKYPDWKPGQRKRPLLKTYSEEEFERALMPEKFIDNPIWTLRDKRCGALAIKIGMMPVWDDWGVRHACTVLWMDRNIVLGHKTVEKHGYSAIQIAAGERKAKNVSKPILGQYKAAEELIESPPYLVREFRITDEANLLPLHTQLHARHFVPGQNIDVTGTSKGKGFQGGMKRHGFAGMPASHGTSLSHRALGSTGNCQDPGKVFKGKKMAGRMGVDRVTMQNLRILKIDRGRDLIYVSGAVPGNKGGFVEIRDAVKKPLWRTDKVLGALERPPLPTFEYDSEIDGTGTAFEEFMPLGEDDPLDPDYMDTTIAIKAQA
ncbi:50S ribosomal protein L3 [Nitzschia inconspicua]|uniref:Large ribosomal subunit protein uL3m n=1 Tax=Nitzschia inconspicua TaxID=303405 RepID=A0A9K3Q620_9STRA|nr:50S ribosomal protein L3 [Nitzschia inconspicua]